MTEYRTVVTPTPPLLRVIDGKLYIELTDGDLTLRAGVGDGRYFFSQVVAKIVDPALRAAYPRSSVGTEFASPND